MRPRTPGWSQLRWKTGESGSGPSAADVDALEQRHDPEHWFPQRSLLSPDTFEAWLARRLELMASGSAIEWAIADAGTDRALGHLTVFERNGTLTGDVAELGYQLVPSARGRGAAKGACRLAISYAFRPKEDGGLGLRRLVAETAADNVASNAVRVPSGSPSSAGSVRRIHCPTAPTVTPSTGSCSARRPHPEDVPGPLARHDRAVDHQLPAPDAQGSRRSRAPAGTPPQWALPAERLGQLDLFRPLGEPELWVVLATGDRPAASRRRARWVLVSDGPGVEIMGPILKSEANLKSRGGLALPLTPMSKQKCRIRHGRRVPADRYRETFLNTRVRLLGYEVVHWCSIYFPGVVDWHDRSMATRSRLPIRDAEGADRFEAFLVSAVLSIA